MPGDCVFIAMLSDEFGLGFQRDKDFFFLSKLSGFLLASPLQGSGDLASSLSPELTSGPGEEVSLAFV